VTSARVLGVHESLRGLLRVRYAFDLADSDEVEKGDPTPLIRHASGSWPHCRFVVVTANPYGADLIQNGRTRRYLLPTQPTKRRRGVVGREAPGATDQAKMDACEGHWDEHLPAEWRRRRPVLNPTIQWVEVSTPEELGVGHGLEFTIRHVGPVAFIEGYPFLTMPWTRIPVRVLAQAPNGCSPRYWSRVMQETRDGISALFTPDSRGRIQLRHEWTRRNLRLYLNC
jgi:hypothetical protein